MNPLRKMLLKARESQKIFGRDVTIDGKRDQNSRNSQLTGGAVTIQKTSSIVKF